MSMGEKQEESLGEVVAVLLEKIHHCPYQGGSWR
jgi:hypothetical protein